MKTKKSSQEIFIKVVSKKALAKNAKALESYSHYKRVSNIVERVDIALGRKTTFKEKLESTLNCEINNYGVISTRSQKI